MDCGTTLDNPRNKKGGVLLLFFLVIASLLATVEVLGMYVGKFISCYGKWHRKCCLNTFICHAFVAAGRE